ncbi:MAG: ZIP family metal transporter [Methylotenera sp.]|nr:ZIP family metal transporter [Methylotenera sp.]MDD4925440.1 ZIP family metal transporter [Methylotenera sp.]
MTLLQIILATLIGGVFSVLLAATVALTFLAKFANRMVAFAVGVLLGFALTDIFPEAVNLGLDITEAGWVLVAGIMLFFLLEKLALWRHDHATSLGKSQYKPQVAMIVIGDGMHNFVDGVLLAAAFLTDWKLGWAAAIAITAHEIPQEISDFMVLLDAGVSKTKALLLNAISGVAMTLGGIIGWLSLSNAHTAIPYVLTLAASSFIYIAVADLVPELHHHRKPKDMLIQLGLMTLGLCVAALAKLLQH